MVRIQDSVGPEADEFHRMIRMLPLGLPPHRTPPAPSPHAAFSVNQIPVKHGLESLEPRLLFSATGDLDVLLVDGRRFLFDSDDESGQIMATVGGHTEVLNHAAVVKISEEVCQGDDCQVTDLVTNLHAAAAPAGGHGHGGHADPHAPLLTHGVFHTTDTGPGGETIRSTYLVLGTGGTPHHGDETRQGEHFDLLDLVGYDGITEVAIDDGRWNEPAVWADGTVPLPGARVLIPHGISMSFNAVITAPLEAVRVDGALHFATWRDTQMTVDTVVVGASGQFTMGTAADPVEDAFTARLVFAGTAPLDPVHDPMQLGRGLLAHGSVALHGRAVKGHLPLAVLPQPGDELLQFTAIDPTWRAGDTLVLTPADHRQAGDDVVTIDHIVGNTVHLTTPIQFDYEVPAPDVYIYAANLSRNVIIESQNKSRASEDLMQRGHVMFMHNRDVVVKHARFDGLGRTDKRIPLSRALLDDHGELIDGTGTNQAARYSLHFHRNGLDASTAPSIVEGAVITNSPGWGLVNHSSYVEVTDAVTYDVDGAGFVTEVGHEIGSFRDSIAIRSQGSGQVPDKRQLVASVVDSGVKMDDFGHSGHGFWLQGNAVEVEGNVAAGHRHAAFAFWSRGLVMGEHDLDAQYPGAADGTTVGDRVGSFRSVPDFPVANLEPVQQPLAWIYNNDNEPVLDDGGYPVLYPYVQSENVRVRLFKDNVAFASAAGLDFSRHMMLRRTSDAPYQADEAGVIEGFMAWGIGDFEAEFGVRNDHQGGNHAITLRYVNHVIIRDSRLFGDANDFDDIAVDRNAAVENVVYENITFVDWNENLGFSAAPGSKPEALDASMVTNSVTPLFIALPAQDADGDALTYELIEAPGYGRIVNFDASAGTLLYVPDGTPVTSDTLRFRAFDGSRKSNVGAVAIRVRPFVGQTIDFNAASPAQFTNLDGATVSVSMIGPGGGEVFVPQNATHASLRFTGTTRNTTITIDVDGAGSTTLEAVTVGAGGAGAIAAPNVTLRRGLLAEGRVGSVTFGDISSVPTFLHVGGDDDSAGVEITLDRVANLDLRSGSPLASVTASSWSDHDDIPDRLTGSTLRELSVAGPFAANLFLAGRPDAHETLHEAAIAGRVTNSAWHIDGNVRSIAVGDRARHWHLNVDGKLVDLILDEAIDIDVHATGALRHVTATQWLGGTLRADAIGSLVAGDPARADHMRFSPDLTLGGDGDRPMSRRLTTGTIHGTLAGSWWVNGAIGTLQADTFARGWSAAVKGRISTLESLAGDFSSWLTARSIGTMIVRGDMTNASIYTGVLLDGATQPHNLRQADFSVVAGRLDALLVQGSVASSLVTVGYDLGDGLFNHDDRFVSPNVSVLGAVGIAGSLDHESRFIAGVLPDSVWITGTAHAPSGLTQFTSAN